MKELTNLCITKSIKSSTPELLQNPETLSAKKNTQLIRTATDAYECKVDHLKRDPIVPKSAKALGQMLKERLEKEVANVYLRDCNSGYLIHRYICDTARKNDFSAVQIGARKTEAHQRSAAQKYPNLQVCRQWIVGALRDFPRGELERSPTRKALLAYSTT